MLTLLADGPVVVAVDSTNWRNYGTGLFEEPNDSPNLNHAVLVVGYTSTYWLIRNSWGDYWGEAGYIKIPRIGGQELYGLTRHVF